MSGGQLPTTGPRGFVTLGLLGLGTYAVPFPVAFAVGGALAVVAGAVLVRLGFRRRTAAPLV